MSSLQQLPIDSFRFRNGSSAAISLSYHVYGKAIHSGAPIVLITHALTGNSIVSGPKGWWKNLIGPAKTIDTNHYTVLAFNIPGNGLGSEVNHWENWSTFDVAQLFWQGLQALAIQKLFAVVGGSLGGGIAWEMAFQKPAAIHYLIPIASNWKASNWVMAQSHVQHQILINSSNPIHDARIHAMLLYRTPQSIALKFQPKPEQTAIDLVKNWLDYHGQNLTKRFSTSAYILMNHLLTTIGQNYQWNDLAWIVENSALEIHQISIDSDLLFTAAEIEKTVSFLKTKTSKNHYHQVISMHGHDAFLIEYDQLNRILSPLFKPL